MRQENDAVRRTLLALVIAAMSTSAFAQMSDGSMRPNLAGGSTKLKTDQDIKREQETEAGYKSGLSKIPDSKAGKADPWGGVRNTSSTATGANQSKASSK
jgi:hypothetical protein